MYREHYPDWRVSQRLAVEAACADPAFAVWVAVEEGATAGFAALRLHEADRMGEIYMIAVDPDFQRRGIASQLTTHALDHMRRRGMDIAAVETGGDQGHGPARAAYEALGFTHLPVARYLKLLDE